MRTEAAPGLALRLTAVLASAAALLAVVSGTLGGGTAHRALAALALPPLVALLLAAALVHRRLLGRAAAALVLLGAAALVTTQALHVALASVHRRLLGRAAAALVLLGAAALVTTQALHVALASLALAATVVLAAGVCRGAPEPRGAWRDYLTLTKPRIMTLLLVTGACGMVVGARGRPDPLALLLMLLGLALACGGASALNHVMDRDIDRLMGERTSGRPVAAGRLSPARGAEFGLALSACSFTLLASAVNVVTALLALVGNLFYVLVYTGYLKRRGPQNIVLGGAAGAVPPLVGWAAATGSLALPALWLFLIVFLWTPPHFWALALLLRDHYAAADVPMLPVVRGERTTVRKIVVYSAALVAFTALPFVLGELGLVYLAGALLLGGVFLLLAMRLGAQPGRRRAAFLFHYSLLYLALLFVVAAVDAAL